MREGMITMDKLEVGQTGSVQSMELNGVMRRRLQDLGVIPGTKVCPTKKSAHNGPTAYMIRETVYALRQEDASKIYVTVE